MNVGQAWLVVGIPGLIVVGGLFVGSSKRRARIGYGVLAVLIGFFLLVPGDPVSGALLGFLAVAFVAAGRGTDDDDRREEHHRTRDQLTRVREGR